MANNGMNIYGPSHKGQVNGFGEQPQAGLSKEEKIIIDFKNFDKDGDMHVSVDEVLRHQIDVYNKTGQLPEGKTVAEFLMDIQKSVEKHAGEDKRLNIDEYGAMINSGVEMARPSDLKDINAVTSLNNVESVDNKVSVDSGNNKVDIAMAKTQHQDMNVKFSVHSLSALNAGTAVVKTPDGKMHAVSTGPSWDAQRARNDLVNQLKERLINDGWEDFTLTNETNPSWVGNDASYKSPDVVNKKTEAIVNGLAELGKNVAERIKDVPNSFPNNKPEEFE